MRRTTAPAACLACGDGANLLNGRYCRKAGRYVEHDAAPPCLAPATGDTTKYYTTTKIPQWK